MHICAHFNVVVGIGVALTGMAISDHLERLWPTTDPPLNVGIKEE
jgi:hypothetical protein